MYYKKNVEVRSSALKHGVRIADVLHGYENAINTFDLGGDDPMKFLLIGPDRSSRLLELIVMDIGEAHVVIHAMKLRRQYAEWLEEPDD